MFDSHATPNALCGLSDVREPPSARSCMCPARFFPLLRGFVLSRHSDQNLMRLADTYDFYLSNLSRHHFLSVPMSENTAAPLFLVTGGHGFIVCLKNDMRPFSD
jgi:hypothetical protein